MRIIALAATALIASTLSAHAHIGHVAEAAGHDHWIALAALGGAAAIAVAIALRQARTAKSDDDATATSEDAAVSGSDEDASTAPEKA